MRWEQIHAALSNPVVAALAVVTTGTATFLVARSVVASRIVAAEPALQMRLAPGVIPPRNIGPAFAQIRGGLTWPVATSDKRLGQVAYKDIYGDVHGRSARRFGASRDGRRHVGVDLFGSPGDPVLAVADGVVVDTQSFHLGTDAIVVQHDGATALYGEVQSDSWKNFGVGVGSRVVRGQPIARIGCMVRDSSGSCESHMLHFETYQPGVQKNVRWYAGQSPPPEILDPTLLLLVASPNVNAH